MKQAVVQKQLAVSSLSRLGRGSVKGCEYRTSFLDDR
jgi:hypothetical protein